MATTVLVIAIIVLLLILYLIIVSLYLWFRWNYRVFKQKRYFIFIILSTVSGIMIGSLGWKIYEEVRYRDEIYIAEKILEFPLPKEYTIKEREVKRDFLFPDYKVIVNLQFKEEAKKEFLRNIQSINNPRGYWKEDKNNNAFEFKVTNYNYEDFYTEVYITFKTDTGNLDFFLMYYNQ